jgi:hypothetical protein
MRVFYAMIYSVVASHAGARGETRMAWAQVYRGTPGVGNPAYGS